ncbi:MAG TPA: glycosyltransferase family 87 protein [Bacteroidales bacterium]
MQSETINTLKRLVSNRKSIVLIFFVVTLGVSIQTLLVNISVVSESGLEYYNNYQIFKYSFFHLIQQQDLYIAYPSDYWDLFKYSPTFAVFFGIFAIFPDWIGLPLWNLLNAFALLFSVYYLQKMTPLQKGLVLLLCTIELITSIQNQQSNGLIAGLLIFAFGFLEKRKYLLATLFIVFSAFIKLFGIVAIILFLFYPKKRKLALYSLIWFLVLFLTPLIFVDIQQYFLVLRSWQSMLANDLSISYGYSILGWLHSWFGLENIKLTTLAIGTVILLIPFLKIKQYNNPVFRYLTLSSVLIWVVIFNHKAESPTYIIAMSGVAIWFIMSKKSTLNIVLLTFAFLLTSLSPTDIFPRSWLNTWVIPYSLKAVPCILIWVKIIYELTFFNESNENISVTEFYKSDS